MTEDDRLVVRGVSRGDNLRRQVSLWQLRNVGHADRGIPPSRRLVVPPHDTYFGASGSVLVDEARAIGQVSLRTFGSGLHQAEQFILAIRRAEELLLAQHAVVGDLLQAIDRSAVPTGVHDTEVIELSEER